MTRTRILVYLPLAAVFVVTDPSRAWGTANPETSLAIEIRSREGVEPERYALTCGPPGGTLPDARGACERLVEAGDPFAPLPPGAMCAGIYGGPEVATVRGVFRGRQVNAVYRRNDGCAIARYARLMRLLGLPGERQ